MPHARLNRSVILLALLLSGVAWADDAAARRDHNWPHWRGPRAEGTAPHATPPERWSAASNVRWKTAVPGEGSATPIVWEDRVFVLAAVPTDREAEQTPVADAQAKTQPPTKYYEFVVLGLDRATGKVLWRQVACEEVPHEGRHPTNTYASGSPVTVGQRLYVSFGSRGVFCYDLDGKLLWRRELGRLKARGGWGVGTAPTVFGDTSVLISHPT